MSTVEKLYGLHAVAAVLRHDATQLRQLWVDSKRRDDRMNALLAQAEQKAIQIQRVSRAQLDQLAHGARHQGIVADYRPSSRAVDETTLINRLKTATAAGQTPLLLVLDGVQDPHNLGACLRSADGAGVNAVIIPSDRAVGLTPTVRNVASGAAETVPLIQVSNLARTLRQLRDHGIWLIGTDDQVDEPYYSADLSMPCALVFGAEQSGLRRLTRQLCDHLIAIPMAGSVTSLNVSVAVGVLLFEAVRQRVLALS